MGVGSDVFVGATVGVGGLTTVAAAPGLAMPVVVVSRLPTLMDCAPDGVAVGTSTSVLVATNADASNEGVIRNVGLLSVELVCVVLFTVVVAATVAVDCGVAVGGVGGTTVGTMVGVSVGPASVGANVGKAVLGKVGVTGAVSSVSMAGLATVDKTVEDTVDDKSTTALELSVVETTAIGATIAALASLGKPSEMGVLGTMAMLIEGDRLSPNACTRSTPLATWLCIQVKGLPRFQRPTNTARNNKTTNAGAPHVNARAGAGSK